MKIQKISNIFDTRDKQQYAFRIRLCDKSDDQQHSLHYSMTLKVYGAKIYGFIVQPKNIFLRCLHSSLHSRFLNKYL